MTLISKACVVGVYQSKLEAIAAHDDVDLTLVVPPYWRENGQVKVLERQHTRGYDLVVAPMALNGSFHLHFYPTVARVLRHTRPDICHVDEEPYNLATYHALCSARRVGARTVVFTWQNILRRYPLPFSAIERYVYGHTDALMAGNADAEQVLRAKGYSGPVRVIPQFGVDPVLFSPPNDVERAPSRPFTVGYAGRLVEEKGLATLADALERLGGEWRLELYGAGPMGKLLERRFAHEAPERVCFRGHVPAARMPGHLRGMDVLVLPSKSRANWREQFGRVLIEAMACEVAVVGSDSGEIPNVIGEAGLVFPEGDADGLAAHLRSLRQDPALRRSLGALGRARVLERYTQAHIAAQTVELYREVLARPPR